MGKIIHNELKKLKKIPHPKSRKTAQLTKKIKKVEGRKKAKNNHLVKTSIIGEKFLWFQKQLPDVLHCTPDILLFLIERYLERFHDELEQIKLKRGVGGKRNRQHASREDIIRITIENEKKEFQTCGLELPDLLNPKQFEMFKNWNGELRFMNNFKLVRYSQQKLENLIQRKSSKSMSCLNLNIFEETNKSRID